MIIILLPRERERERKDDTIQEGVETHINLTLSALVRGIGKKREKKRKKI